MTSKLFYYGLISNCSNINKNYYFVRLHQNRHKNATAFSLIFEINIWQ
jgi:hypothetical protein